MDTNDKLLKDFFSANKQEIIDNGFSQRVMRKLPEQADRSWIVWVFACIGISLTFFIGIENGAFKDVLHFAQNIPIYYVLGGVFLFPIVGSVGACFLQGKSCVMRY